MNTNPPLYINVKEIVDENFQDYKKASMFIATVKCDFKCLKEKGMDFSICQNSKIAKLPNKKVFIPDIFQRYMNNPLTSAVVVGGLEPMLQFEEVLNLVSYFRNKNCNDDFVIYTGYYATEVANKIKLLQSFNNIIIKYGRFIPDSNPVFDDVLGINLNSENQHAVKIT
ncbi:MAG: 4Fe-4S cluster-binding domain-containing protein [Clostridia bacterium]|nr:4Fe-4S cluster-binding domain-containing protein [Clostridia bacterium]